MDFIIEDEKKEKELTPIEKLKVLSEDIDVTCGDYSVKKSNYEKNKEEIKDIESKIYSKICNELNEENAKPKYSNETRRQTEVKERLKKDMTYITLKTKLNDLKYDIMNIEFTIETLKRDFDILKLEANVGDSIADRLKEIVEVMKENKSMEDLKKWLKI